MRTFSVDGSLTGQVQKGVKRGDWRVCCFWADIRFVADDFDWRIYVTGAVRADIGASGAVADGRVHETVYGLFGGGSGAFG